MPDIPDSVISDAVKAVPATQAGVGSARLVCQIVARAAPVIAAWAREQERERSRDTYRTGTRMYAERNDLVILLRSLLTDSEEVI